MKTWVVLLIVCAAVATLQHLIGWAAIPFLAFCGLVVYWTAE